MKARKEAEGSYRLSPRPNYYDNQQRKFERVLLPPAAGPLNNSRGSHIAVLGKVEFGKSIAKT